MNRYNILGPPQEYTRFEVNSSREDLEWEPRYDFLWMEGAAPLE